ncbi:MAG TPA: DUF2267 domain-containing protein [Anaerolineae bacterium]|nr:DUF2267 domain-containing protein [Anaerolineae bacterium]HOR00065.1 DUF2267 domain-containing protein [Anaerolineae bacterium]HPL30096.1 DUF2267 domain-containing protein [Anaerolineae bacterium]
MDRKEFLDAVKQRSGLDEGQAKAVTLAALADLRDALPDDEATDLASQLPRGLKETVQSPSTSPRRKGPLEMQALVEHLRTVLRPEDRPRASQAAHAVASTLRDAITPGQLQDISGAFPPELQRDLQAG